MSGSDASARSLTGVWQGLYSYPGPGAMVPFTATLIESGGSFGGSTHEICRIGRGRLATLCAFIDGARRGARIDFIKTYDGSAGWSHAIVYDGALNADGTEIDGRWRGQGGSVSYTHLTLPTIYSV